VMKILWFEKWRLFYTDCEPNERAWGCTLQSCFDFNRCPTDKSEFRFSIDPIRASFLKAFDDSEQYQEIKKALLGHPWYTSDASEACIFFPDIDSLCVISACGGPKWDYKGDMGAWTVADQLAKLEHWNGGKNHLVIEIHDSEELRYDIGMAMGVKSGFAAESYRVGFDISFPLYANVPVNDTALRLTNRSGKFAYRSSKYLLTFKGGFNRRHNIRRRLLKLHNPSRDIVLVHSSNRAWDYANLMANTKFALIVQGNGLHSYRLTEAMRANAIPVILADNYVLPFSEKILWEEFSIFVPQSDMMNIPAIIQRIDDERLAHMRERLAEVYEKHFASFEQMIDTVLDITRDRIFAHSFVGHTTSQN